MLLAEVLTQSLVISAARGQVLDPGACQSRVTKRNLRDERYLLRREASMLRRAGQVRADAYPTWLLSGSQRAPFVPVTS